MGSRRKPDAKAAAATILAKGLEDIHDRIKGAVLMVVEDELVGLKKSIEAVRVDLGGNVVGLRQDLRELRTFTLRQLGNHPEGGTLADMAQEIPADQQDFDTQAIRRKKEPEDPWQHRSAGMRCSTCMYFVEKGPGVNPAAPEGDRIMLGRCRRNAPRLGGFPVVTTKDWCGEHKLA